MTKKMTVHCTNCGDPVYETWDEAFSFDTQWILCKQCKPQIKKPRVTLFGAPDGQELGRWSQ